VIPVKRYTLVRREWESEGLVSQCCRGDEGRPLPLEVGMQKAGFKPVDFLGFSYGFRPKRSQHDALDASRFGLVCGDARVLLKWIRELRIVQQFIVRESIEKCLQRLLLLFGHVQPSRKVGAGTVVVAQEEAQLRRCFDA
jgi:hypothetical protein